LDFPSLPDGVKPNGLAMDNSPLGNFGADCFFGTGFIGYPRLAELAQISEYRSVSETTANEMTRQWIEIKSVGEEDNSETIKQIEECYERLNVRDVFRTRNMRALPGNMGLGQVRYPTAGTGRSGQGLQSGASAHDGADPAMVDDVVAVGGARCGRQDRGEVEVSNPEVGQVRDQFLDVGEGEICSQLETIGGHRGTVLRGRHVP